MKASTARNILNLKEFEYDDVIHLIKKACEKNKECIFMRKDTYMNDTLVSRLRLDGYIVFYIKNNLLNLMCVSWAAYEVKEEKKSLWRRMFG